MKLLKSITFFSVFILVLTNLAFAQTTYVWNGSVNSSFSTAGNWTPFRQIGLTNDILVFQNGINLNVTNVNQVTIGQLIIRNNTNLTLSPSSGNAKCITVKGDAGEDFSIESGSSLTISGNDPKLTIYLNTNATAEIKGSLTFTGSIAHNINSFDELAIKFKSGSVFTQSCPGNIFNTTGVSNSVVFEDGSSFRVNHSEAVNPFGISAPGTKVKFEDGSSLNIFNVSSLQLSGRNIANLVVEPNATVNISESFTQDVTIKSISVKPSGTLNIVNTNAAYIPSFNIHGSISAEGTLRFSENSPGKFNIHLNGIQPQTISGTGQIIIPANINSFTLENSVVLQRDLTIYCTFNHISGTIAFNSFTFIVNINNNPVNVATLRAPSTESYTISGNNNNTAGANTNAPMEYSVSQNYPNPFNPSTKIDYTLPRASKVTIKIFDITGREVLTLINAEVEAGSHTVNFNASNLSSGIYFYTINTEGFTKTMKMILTK